MKATVVKYLIFSALLFLPVFLPAQECDRLQDSLALVTLYNDTDGPNWMNKWDLGRPLDEWSGVSLNPEGCVRYLLIEDQNASGILPDPNLPNLEILIIQGTNIMGAIPDFSGLPALQTLGLANNQLSGEIPDFSHLENLREINLQSNQLTGPVPDFSNLPDLSTLLLGANQLSGEIPDFTNMPALSNLRLQINNLTGSIPVFSNLPNLSELDLRWNQLSGSLPPALPTLGLNVILLNDNQFSGCFPDTYAAFCGNLYDFSNNPGLPWNGAMDRWCNGEDQFGAPCNDGNPFTVDEIITTDCNCQERSISSCDRQRDSLALVALYEATDGMNWDSTWNLLQPMDRWFGVKLSAEGCVQELTMSLSEGQLIGNGLNGVLPEEITRLSEIEVIDLSRNRDLRGTIPISINQLSKLRGLSFSVTGMEGPIPSTIGELANLTSIVLFSADFSGELPASIGDLISLENLLLYNNRFSGPIPPEFANLNALKHLRLGSNQLQGPFPEFLTDLSNLWDLDLRANNFFGPIPPSLGDLSDLRNLWLDHNNFEGEIPTAIATLSKLASFNIQGNQFENLPDLSEIGTWGQGSFSGVGVQVDRNHFSFQDILPNMPIGDIARWIYAPQAPFFPDTTFTTIEGRPLTIHLGIDEGIETNVYQWYKDGQLIQTITGSNQFSLADPQIQDSGFYRVEITNPGAPDLTLESGAIEITVLETCPPLPVCPNDITVQLIHKPGNYDLDGDRDNDPGYVILKPEDFNLGGLEDCMEPFTLSIDRVGGLPVPEQTELILTCDDLGAVPIELRAWDQSGVSNACQTSVNLVDNTMACSPTPDTLIVSAANARVREGDQFCVDIPADHFFDLISAYFMITYDTNFLAFDTIQQIIFPNVNPGNFDLFFDTPRNTLPTEKGLVNVTWNAADENSELSFPNGTILFQVCFTARSPGQTELEIGTNTPPITNNTIFSNSEAPFLGQPGLVNIEAFCRQRDSLALVALYEATGGTNWTNTWELTHPVASWYGVEVSDEGCATCLDLDGNPDCLTGDLSTGNGLAGALPVSLGDLSEVQLVSFSNNQLSGEIPASLGQLVSLSTLSLSYNEFKGPIPPDLGNLTGLSKLFLNYNQLSGPIPPELGALSSLRNIALNNNQLEGSLPPEFENLPFLRTCYLQRNKLTGTIPSEWGNLTNLERLNLSGNELQGVIPPEFGRLKNLFSLDLHNNNLTGNIPDEIGQLENLEFLSLHNNQLSGSIPIEIGALDQVTHIYLHSNRLTGRIPETLGMLSNLTVINLSENLLEGIIPDQLSTLSLLEGLFMANNNLTGSVPDFSRSQLKGLWLQNNALDNLPDLLAIDSWEQGGEDEGCIVDGNQFTFKDILPNMPVGEVTAWTYAPQDSIFQTTTLALPLGQNLSIDLDIDAGITSNVYTWYKNGQFWATITGDNHLRIDNFSPADTGRYEVQVTNSNAPDLTLYGRPITLNLDCTAEPGSIYEAAPIVPPLSCNGEAQLTANLPPGGEGYWENPDGGLLDDMLLTDAVITGLRPGRNQLAWTVSIAACPDYSRDVGEILYAEAPEVVADTFSFYINKGHTLDLLSNDRIYDQLLSAEDFPVTFRLVRPPDQGLLQTQTLRDAGGRTVGEIPVFYTPEEDFLGRVTMEYELCHAACPDNCSTGRAVLNVIPEVNPKIRAPNVITPNGDALNEFFVIKELDQDPGSYPNNRLAIFNEWGTIVWEQENYANNWNGVNQNGNPLPQATYYFLFEYGNGEEIWGHVVILKE